MGQSASWRRHGPLGEGDLVLLVDLKGRRYTARLEAGHTFHCHLGAVGHDQIMGQEEGCLVQTNRGHRLLALRPTLTEAILEMPRGAQIIYPKDLGSILMRGDIFPGAQVVEAGLGSGALTMALLRAVGFNGHVTSYEVRQDMADKAVRNIKELAPGCINHTIKMQDVYETGIQEREVDRVLLDLPEPWHLADSAACALVPGGIFLSYLPTVLQIHRLVEALEKAGRFQLIDTVEVLERPWHIAGQSVRPVHRMVAHTGFITTARRCQTGPTPSRPQE